MFRFSKADLLNILVIMHSVLNLIDKHSLYLKNKRGIKLYKAQSLKIIRGIKHIRELRFLKLGLNETKDIQWVWTMKEEAMEFCNLKLLVESKKIALEWYSY